VVPVSWKQENDPGPIEIVMDVRSPEQRTNIAGTRCRHMDSMVFQKIEDLLRMHPMPRNACKTA
jgi:hypothetical protein